MTTRPGLPYYMAASACVQLCKHGRFLFAKQAVQNNAFLHQLHHFLLCRRDHETFESLLTTSLTSAVGPFPGTHLVESEQPSKMAEKKVDIKKFDTTKMSGEELKKLGLEGSRKPPGSSAGPGSTLHQQSGQGLNKAGRYPFIMWGVAAVVGIATFSYYRSLGAQDIPGKSNQALESNHPATAKAPSER